MTVDQQLNSQLRENQNVQKRRDQSLFNVPKLIATFRWSPVHEKVQIISELFIIYDFEDIWSIKTALPRMFAKTLENI